MPPNCSVRMGDIRVLGYCGIRLLDWVLPNPYGIIQSHASHVHFVSLYGVASFRTPIDDR